MHFLKWFQAIAAALAMTLGGTAAHADSGRSAVKALEFSPGRVSFSVDTGGTRTAYSVSAIFVLPGEEVPLTLEEEAARATSIRTSAGTLQQSAPARWHWRAPQEPGLYPIEVHKGEETLRLNAFVLVPAAQVTNERLNGYRIGAYPDKPASLLPDYSAPAGFVEVTPENRTVLVSPHFRLEQFLCKQMGSFPKYVVLREKLLHKLELVLERLNESGRYARTLHVMSGYRTPFYNHAIGNVSLSRHQYGDAADVFVDADGNHQMDDLNRDGKSDERDAHYLSAIVDQLERAPMAASLMGGLATYRRNHAHGPFVHIDARGTPARW